jgi:hypothetical protein
MIEIKIRKEDSHFGGEISLTQPISEINNLRRVGKDGHAITVSLLTSGPGSIPE